MVKALIPQESKAILGLKCTKYIKKLEKLWKRPNLSLPGTELTHFGISNTLGI